jgi:hypothetical protein
MLRYWDILGRDWRLILSWCYFALRRCQLNYIASNGRMIHKWWTGKDLKGSCHGLMGYCHWICLDELRKIVKTITHDNRCSGRDLKWTCPEYKWRPLLLNQPARSLRCQLRRISWPVIDKGHFTTRVSHWSGWAPFLYPSRVSWPLPWVSWPASLGVMTTSLGLMTTYLGLMTSFLGCHDQLPWVSWPTSLGLMTNFLVSHDQLPWVSWPASLGVMTASWPLPWVS